MKRQMSLLIIVMVIFTSGPALGYQDFDYFDVHIGMQEALKAIKADDFKIENDVSGAGIKVAIIDTGIDVSHPDLQKTPQGRAKIIDFVDFTNEGLVNTKVASKAVDDHVLIEGERYNVEGLPTRSGIFRVGTFRESQISADSPLSQDINRNGKSSDVFGVIVTDSVLPGIYDTVYVDTNLNLDFTDEKPLKVFSKSLQWARFGRDNPATQSFEESSFVVSEIDVMGNWIKISFDGNSHGTHVAGILGANGKLVGTAPGVQIIAIKALCSVGDGSWSDIAKAIDYAQKKGADIINISIGSLATSLEDHEDQLNLFKKVSLEKDALIVIASGNQGPGLATAYDAGNSESVITVGAYMSEALWNINYNIVVPGETLWFYTGAGPQKNGTLAPSVVAPSTVISSVNRWDSGGYFVMDGTSMAAPFASGSAALILEKARKSQMNIDAWSLRKSLELGARKISGYHEFEQGYGLIDVKNSWEVLNKETYSLDNIGIKVADIPGYTRGIFLKDKNSGRKELSLINLSSTSQELKIETQVPWITIENKEILLPRGKPQQISFSYNIPKKPGIYSGKIVGKEKLSNKTAFEFDVTAVIPFDLKDRSKLQFSNSLMPSRWQRYFLKTTPEISELTIRLDVLKKDLGFMGRGLLCIYDPDGQMVFESYAGGDYIKPLPNTEFRTAKPKAGIWEVVIVSDYYISDFGASNTTYKLTVDTLKGMQ